MHPIDPNTARLSPALRALAMGLVVETVVPMLGRSQQDSPAPGHGEGGAGARAASWQDLRWKCDELMALVLDTDDPKEAAAYVLGYLPKHVDCVFDLLCGRKRKCVPLNGEALATVPAGASRPRA
jgi:hypothetical protein